MTKNITLAIDEDLLDRARVLAAIRRTSVNEMVRRFLQGEVEAETGRAHRAEAWTKLFVEIDARAAERKTAEAGDRRFNREEMYEEVMRERGLL